eukprot:13744172-Ditylum_brightwellii.AAC.1
MALNNIAVQQSHAAQETADAVANLLNYCATYPGAILRYHVSNIQLYVHSNASCLSKPHALSQARGHFFLSSKLEGPTKAPHSPPNNNGAVHTKCTKTKAVMVSVVEVEFGTLFTNCKVAVDLHIAL